MQHPGLVGEVSKQACFKDINPNIKPSTEIKQGFVASSNAQAGRNSTFCSGHMVFLFNITLPRLTNIPENTLQDRVL